MKKSSITIVCLSCGRLTDMVFYSPCKCGNGKFEVVKPDTRKSYCGPFYFPKFIREWASKDFNFCCQLHDEAYNQQSLSRKEVDKVFLENMLRSAKEGMGTEGKAKAYYYIVRVIGLPSWYMIKLYKKLGFKL